MAHASSVKTAGSRPPLRGPRGWVQRRFTRSRCHRKMVAGVTMRFRRQMGDSNRVSAANTARSAHDSRGLRTWRRNTATSCRSTRISTSFDRELRASSPSQDMTCRKIRYNSRTATTGDHARPPPSSDAGGHRRGWPIRHPQAILGLLLTGSEVRSGGEDVSSFQERFWSSTNRRGDRSRCMGSLMG
jgi:hypothetical protein